MGRGETEALSKRWEAACDAVLSLKPPSLPDLQGLLRDSYKTLSLYHKRSLVPKEIGRILIAMENYLFFSAMMEEKELGDGAFCYQRVHLIVKALERGFLDGFFPLKSPRLEIRDDTGMIRFLDLESQVPEQIFCETKSDLTDQS